jgi:hypothetical protein
MINRIIIRNSERIILDIPIVEFDIFEKDIELDRYSNLLELTLNYKDGGDLIHWYDNTPSYRSELILYSLEKIECVSIERFTIEQTSLYDDLFHIKIHYRDFLNTNLSVIPELKSLYRDIQINKILNNV